MKRFFSTILILSMIFSNVFQVAYAATYSVGSADELAASWYDSNQGIDTSNTFNMTNDIDMDNTPLDVINDRTYTINGKGNELSEVSFRDGDGASKPATESEGTVNVNADVTSNNSVAVWVDGNITVNVKGDVDANGKATDPDRPFGVQAENGAEVTIRGDVTSDGHAYYVGNDNTGRKNPEASLTVTGDVVGKLSSSANNGGIVSVGGNMKSDGVFVTNSSLEVGGNLNAGSVLYAVEGSDADIDGDVTAQVVSLQSGSSLNVGDDIKGHVTVDGSTLVVGGDITSDNSDALRVGTYPNQSGVTWGEVDDSVVMVGGNVVSTTGGGTAVVASGHTTTIIEGNASGNPVDVEVDDHAQVIVKGKADNVLVSDDASVKVGNKGATITPPSSSDPYFGPASQSAKTETTTETKKVKYLSDAELIELCKGFSGTSMTPLRMQWYNFDKVLNGLSQALNDELTLFNAVIISLFGHTDMMTKSITIYDIQEMTEIAKHSKNFASTPWNESSVENLLETNEINTYQVAIIREVLAKAIDSVPETSLEVAKKETEEINSIVKKIYSVYKNAALNEEMRDALEKAYKDGTFSYNEASNFAIKFLGYKKKQDGFSTAVKRVQDISDFLSTVNKVSGYIDKAFTLSEFAQYWFENYDSRINALDNMIKNQSMDEETFIAALELRTMMKNKWLGTAEKFAEIGAGALIKTAMGAFPPLLAAEAALDIVGIVTGISSRNDALETGAALTGVLNDALYNYKALIEKVENGDTSEETLSLLRSSFSMVTECFEMYYRALLELTPKKDADYKKYEKLVTAFQNTYMGEKVTIPY